MCTAVSCNLNSHYFGRNLDVEGNYGETIVITPRNFILKFRNEQEIKNHYAIIGIAKKQKGYPLYFDATNEKGLSMAALNFPGNAVYKPVLSGKVNLAPYELFLWILEKCKSVTEAEVELETVNIADLSFSPDLPNTTLHWIISDRERSITVESVRDGLKIYDNPVGILTNSPTFDIQLFNLNNYMTLSTHQPKNTFSENLNLKAYSFGMGGFGLPGDMSSMSRFVRAAFVSFNICRAKTEEESVSQFFHILGTVSQPKGCTRLENGGYEYTSYSTCCNTETGQFYYKTYENSRINCISLFSENLDGDALVSYPILRENDIYIQNGEK